MHNHQALMEWYTQIPKQATIAVGMSVGVDSTMAALLLLEQGFSVVGLTMQIWDGSVCLPQAGRPGCFGPGEAEDLEAARAAARRLGIAHHTISLCAEYRTQVLESFSQRVPCRPHSQPLRALQSRA